MPLPDAWPPRALSWCRIVILPSLLTRRSMHRPTEAQRNKAPGLKGAALRRVAVHVFQPAMSEHEDRRHIQSSADDLDVGARFAVAGGLHRGFEFAERSDPGGEPIGTTERARQVRISQRG